MFIKVIQRKFFEYRIRRERKGMKGKANF